MRKKDVNWTINQNHDGTTSTENAHLAVLMDIRDELKNLNSIFSCHNFLNIPYVLREIRNNTKKRKKNVKRTRR